MNIPALAFLFGLALCAFVPGVFLGLFTGRKRRLLPAMLPVIGFIIIGVALYEGGRRAVEYNFVYYAGGIAFILLPAIVGYVSGYVYGWIKAPKQRDA